MTMTLESFYKSLTERELRKLIKNNDDSALDEFLRRCDTGEIKRVTYTIEQMDQMIDEVQGKKKAS